ncbi:MAG: hypothetical protein FJ044_05745 [Candidatus Cloacimonetes bacterium]|nr:hypothetical protein [Candidatus Cloacimonadota bacterium]
MNITQETIIQAFNSWTTFLAIILLGVALMTWAGAIMTTRSHKETPQAAPTA